MPKVFTLRSRISMKIPCHQDPERTAVRRTTVTRGYTRNVKQFVKMLAVGPFLRSYHDLTTLMMLNKNTT